MWVILSTLSRRMFEFASMSITLAPALPALASLQPANAFQGGQRPDGTSASRENIFPGRYSEIFGRGERP